MQKLWEGLEQGCCRLDGPVGLGERVSCRIRQDRTVKVELQSHTSAWSLSVRLRRSSYLQKALERLLGLVLWVQYCWVQQGVVHTRTLHQSRPNLHCTARIPLDRAMVVGWQAMLYELLALRLQVAIGRAYGCG